VTGVQTCALPIFCCRHPDGSARKHAGRIQGKALVWAEVCGPCVQRIIGWAKLPTKPITTEAQRTQRIDR